jgi:DNA primase
VAHVLDTLSSDRDLNDPKVKSEIAAQILPLIEDLPNPVERDSYRQMLARRLRVDERSLSGTQAPVSPVRRQRPKLEPVKEQKPARVTPTASRSKVVEASCLALLLRRPDLLPHLDRRLQESGLGALSVLDFEYTDHQLILRLIQQSLEQDESEQAHYVESHLDESLRETFTSLLAQPAPKGADDKIKDEIFRQVKQIRQQSWSASVNQLRFIQEDAQQAGELSEINRYGKLQLQYARMKNLLDNAK